MYNYGTDANFNLSQVKNVFAIIIRLVYVYMTYMSSQNSQHENKWMKLKVLSSSFNDQKVQNWLLCDWSRFADNKAWPTTWDSQSGLLSKYLWESHWKYGELSVSRRQECDTLLLLRRSYTGYKFAKKMLNRRYLARKKNNIKGLVHWIKTLLKRD